MHFSGGGWERDRGYYRARRERSLCRIMKRR
jgi:hypothetical protein